MAKPSLDDRFEISDLFIQYATSLDACDTESVIACFTPDGWLESPVKGRYQGHDDIRRFAEDTARIKAERGGQFRHVLTNLRIDVDGDRAWAKCYLLDYLTVDGKTELLSPGEYECELVRVDGSWRFRSRLVHMDVVFKNPNDPVPQPKPEETR